MSNLDNFNSASIFNSAFPSAGYNPFTIYSNLNKSGGLDISQITCLLQLQNIRDNLPPPQSQAAFPGVVLTKTKPNMDHFFTPNGSSGSSLNRVQIQTTEPSFLNSNVALFNQANGPAVPQPDVPRGIHVPIQLRTSPSPNSIGYELPVSPLALSVRYPFQMEDQNSSSDYYQVADHGAKTYIPGSDEAPQNQLVKIDSGFGLGITNYVPDAENEVIRRLKNDGRIHSLPHNKYGPCYCPFPECKDLVFPTSQLFGAHTQAYHYSGETVEEKKRRQERKYGTAKRDLSLGLIKDGHITVMPGSLNYRPARAGRIEKSGRGKAKSGVQNQDHPNLFAQYEQAIKQGILNSGNNN